MEFEMELQKYFGPIVLLLSKTSSSEHYLKLFTIGVCEQAGLKIGCWESPKSPHCTIYSLTSRPSAAAAAPGDKKNADIGAAVQLTFV